ncbi:hypothetical protein ONZ45_g10046 [Pleurotus djamor]|nr:hypothetical protein ONZ45_g10046 [Pleurotus djamor]
MSPEPPILNVHTPTSSFAIVHSTTEETLQTLYDKLSRKGHTDYHGKRVGPGWLKYEFRESVWNLDDESDYTIFNWRRQESNKEGASTSSVPSSAAPSTPTLYLHDPSQPLPTPPAYLNPSYYAFRASSLQLPTSRSASRSSHGGGSMATRRTKASKQEQAATDGLLQFRKDFEKFHSENGVRTVMGSIGPVKNVRMLLKSGYRHVYISRKFAQRHGFIPEDATPGLYGYGGLVNIGKWPITLIPSSTFSTHPDDPPPPAERTRSHANGKSKGGSGPQVTVMPVYLSEEPHFDVVLGRSFFERRQIRVSSTDPTDVVCMDTGEKIECELVILKDGKGDIVTVT